jgi:hypothetical protein
MFNFREYFHLEFEKLCNALGIDPTLGITIIFLVFFSHYLIKSKNWSSLSNSQKFYFYAGWFYLFMLILLWTIKIQNGY